MSYSREFEINRNIRVLLDRKRYLVLEPIETMEQVKKLAFFPTLTRYEVTVFEEACEAVENEKIKSPDFYLYPKFHVIWNKRQIQLVQYKFFEVLSSKIDNPSSEELKIFIRNNTPTGMCLALVTSDIPSLVVAGVRPLEGVKLGMGFLGLPGIFMKMHRNQSGREVLLFSVFCAEALRILSDELGLFPGEALFNFIFSIYCKYVEKNGQDEITAIGTTKLSFSDIQFRANHNPFKPDHIGDKYLLGLNTDETANVVANGAPIAFNHLAGLLEAHALNPEFRMSEINYELKDPTVAFIERPIEDFTLSQKEFIKKVNKEKQKQLELEKLNQKLKTV